MCLAENPESPNCKLNATKYWKLEKMRGSIAHEHGSSGNDIKESINPNHHRDYALGQIQFDIRQQKLHRHMAKELTQKHKGTILLRLSSLCKYNKKSMYPVGKFWNQLAQTPWILGTFFEIYC